MTNYSELQLFVSHVEKLKEELARCKDPELKKSIQDEIIFFNNTINQLNKNNNI